MIRLAVALILSSFLSLTAQAGLTELTTPQNVSEAVAKIYELGRDGMDSGGIHTLTIFENKKSLKTFSIVRSVMSSSDELSEISRLACGKLKRNACVRKVLTHSEDVNSNFGSTDAFELISELREWEPDDNKAWQSSLSIVEQYLKDTLGEGFATYSFGYDHVADVFALVMISKDRSKVIVLIGDLGA